MVKNNKNLGFFGVIATLSVLALSALSLPAQADGISLTGVGILNFSSTTLSTNVATSQSISSGTSVGFGLLAGLGVMPAFELQLGALWVPRKFSLNDANGNTLDTYSSPWLEIPLLLRFTGLPFISVGAGPYYAVGLGNANISAPNTSTFSQSLGASGLVANDFGLEASVAASFPILPFISVVGDLRYLFGLTNLSNVSGTTQNYRDWEFMAGVSIGI